MFHRAASIWVLVFVVCINCSVRNLLVPVELFETFVQGEEVIPFSLAAATRYATIWGLEDAYSHEDNFLPGIQIELDFYDDKGQGAVALERMINYSLEGITIVTGNPVSNVLAVSGIAAPVYNVAHLSAAAITPILSDKSRFPWVSRLVPEASVSMTANHALIQYYISEGAPGWDKAALIATTDVYGISLADRFVAEAPGDFEISEFQTILPDQTVFTEELTRISDSGARIILFLGFETHFRTLIKQANEIGLVDDLHVWLVAEGVVITSVYIDSSTGKVDEEAVAIMRGEIGTIGDIPLSGLAWDRFVAHWHDSDPNLVPFSGPGTLPDAFSTAFYDLGYMIGLIVNEAFKLGYLDNNSYPNAEQWTQIIRSTEFEGATGYVTFTDIGNRTPRIAERNFLPEKLEWKTIGVWTPEDGYIPNGIEAIWYDNTTNVPDLDVRDPFHYFSCSDGNMKYDSTGKSVRLHSPDIGSSVDDIDEDYRCDAFIDCWNLSDEAGNCKSNYTILFVVAGVVCFVLILILFLFLIFTILFGYVIKRSRVRANSPFFLLLIIMSGFLGYISIFTWYGKPHPVACGFQPWLLGLAVSWMISALCAKTFRVWRIFAIPLQRTKIQDWELFVLWIVMLVPAFFILILWTIVSTPTAELRELQGEEHYVCTTGGFTGEPGGIVFFGILVAYESLLLLFAVFLSIVTRNVPTLFNESRLLAISIYNLGFLAVVVIPVYFVVVQINPFAAWIIRTCAILYAFTATLWVQFLPAVIGIVFIDHFQNIKVSQKMLSSSVSKTNSGNSSVY